MIPPTSFPLCLAGFPTVRGSGLGGRELLRCLVTLALCCDYFRLIGQKTGI